MGSIHCLKSFPGAFSAWLSSPGPTHPDSDSLLQRASPSGQLLSLHCPAVAPALTSPPLTSFLQLAVYQLQPFPAGPKPCGCTAQPPPHTACQTHTAPAGREQRTSARTEMKHPPAFRHLKVSRQVGQRELVVCRNSPFPSISELKAATACNLFLLSQQQRAC